MNAIPVTPCAGWTPVWTCALPTGAGPISGIALAAAASVLDDLTGHQYGVCQMTIRPCRRECYEGLWDARGMWWEWGTWPRPLFYRGAWSNITCGGGCIGTCSCTSISEVLLPSPVSGIGQVKIDGSVLPASAYRVDDYRKLIRVDGNEWPICQELNKADTEVGTWSVTFNVGMPLPPLGQMALGELALQFIKLLLCDKSCMLPKPVQSLSRQGVTMNFLDPTQVFPAGRVGLYLSDLFIGTVNPGGLRSRSRVFDVDGDSWRIAGT